ncbi:sensor protein ZraS [mine drainage metagenome]|uniref:histidine kinase n=1 Tax=mine drainage metagenome TaxID=410659 RepID=A0A1J5SG34_9ZZZZ
MIFKSYQANILWRVLFLFLTLSLASFFLTKGFYVYEIIVFPVILLQLYDLFRFHRKTQDEVDQFVEAIHYKDFSRNFNVSNAPVELKSLRKGFNEINTTFKLISREKETQYLYLQKILELVDTGILSYETESGEIVWMNESLKKLLLFPYLRTIHSLEKRDKELYEHIVTLNPGESVIATVHQENVSLKVLLSATSFQTDEKKYNLIAFQNINVAIDETESKAWQKLLSVMTHEIMNSVAPISSLADTLKTRLQHIDKNDTASLTEDLEIGIDTIKRRSDGLLRFAQVYRNLNKVTEPNLKTVNVSDLFENMHRLMQPTLDQKHIELEMILKEPNLAIDVDINLIEQVLINLIINAIDAVKEKKKPKIVLTATRINQKTIIKVADNGSGMPKEITDKIFIPFFSTKKNGSGIGLSLCKQIMMLHKANIQVQSIEGVGTVFYLQF